MPHCECLFVPADIANFDRTLVVLQVVLLEAAATMVLHVGCTGRPGHCLSKLKRPRTLGEEGSYDSVSITWER